MPSPNIIVRDPDGLRELIETRAAEEHRSVSDVVRSAVRQYLTGDGGGDTLTHALARAGRAEAEAGRLRAELEAARMGVLAKRATAADRDARARLAADREERFAMYLGAATRDAPAAPAGAARVSGFSYYWSRDLLRALAEAGYAEKLADGRYVPVPGMDVREGIGKARVLAQHGSARIAPSRRETREEPSPAPAPAEPATEATGTAEVHPAAARGEAPREARTERPAARKRASAGTRPPVAASSREAVMTDLRERVESIAPGTVMFQEPGAERVVTVEVPEAADHSAKQGRQHALNCKCGVCRPRAAKP